MDKMWEPVQVDLTLADIANYKAESDWMHFDCVCTDTSAPGWVDLPYDFALETLAPQSFTCPRCGRWYRVRVKVEVEMYTPLTLRYPNVPDKMPSATLGLREKE